MIRPPAAAERGTLLAVTDSPRSLPRVLTFDSALGAGYTRARVRTEVRRGRWTPLAPGIYLTRPEAPDRDDWARVGLLVAGHTCLVSGWDALRRYDLGSPWPPVADVLVLAERGTHRRVGGVWIRPSGRPMMPGRPPRAAPGRPQLPVVSAARAVADTALVYRRPEPVRAFVTAAVQRRLCTPDELAAELAVSPRNGSAHLRRAVEDVLGGARSIAEANAADVLRSGTVPRFELNVPIVDGTGRVVYVADVLWRELRAVLEVDSRKHHFLETDWRRTMDRHNALTRLGLAVAHYPPQAFRDRPRALVAEVETWLRTRARELGVPYVGATRWRRRGHPTPFRLPQIA